MESRKVLFIGGHPKGYAIPFHPLTLSGKRLRALAGNAHLDAEYLDLWACQNEENIGMIGKDLVERIMTMMRNRVVIVALGKWVYACMNRAGIKAIYLPHPAARRKRDLVALDHGIRALSRSGEDIGNV